jgi:hypothetical protein
MTKATVAPEIADTAGSMMTIPVRPAFVKPALTGFFSTYAQTKTIVSEPSSHETLVASHTEGRVGSLLDDDRA